MGDMNDGGCKRQLKRWGILFPVLLAAVIAGIIYSGRPMEERNSVVEKTQNTGKTALEITAQQQEKGYDLPIGDAEKEEAKADCKRVMELFSDIYKSADKGAASNVVLSDEIILAIQSKVSETGCPVKTALLYSNLENHKKMEVFLKACLDGTDGSIVVYAIRSDGGIGRMKFIFDKEDMYILSVSTVWNEKNEPGIASVSYSRIKHWRYSEKGWFCYEMCVPEPPQVSEIVDGGSLMRIKPMTEEKRKMSRKCVQGLGYQGNNLLRTDWDTDHMEKLDYNGMYEYLYEMKYHKKFKPENYPDGIPEDEFESLIMEYLPLTAEQIREYAVYDEEKQVYPWARLGGLNYAPTSFGASLPEVTNIKENEDGTVTLTVDAVSDYIVHNEAIITHELTVRFAEDGSFRYLGNKILDDGIRHIPDYQYRMDMLFSSIGGTLWLYRKKNMASGETVLCCGRKQHVRCFKK